MSLEIALDSDAEWDSSEGPDWAELAQAAARAAIAESRFPALADAARPVELSVQLSGDEQVRALNAEWRGKDKPTNVLSFPMADERDLTQANVDGRELLLGDVI